uniref:Replication factor C subunit 3 (inferred by orthology to a human protein) n=1 Tax=Strongyloides venezuelensis TaxID=75913 RepID=A0A0K0G0L2_STRVS
MTTLGVFPTIKRSTKLLQLSFHKELNQTLHNVVEGQDFGHLLFYGPPGGGRRTRIRALLKGIYGDGVSTVKIEKRECAVQSSSKKISYSILSSNCHIELTASGLGSSDKLIIQNVIKEMAQSKQLNETKQKSFKVVVIFEAENLSKDAQHALRRTMEKYSHNCRIIMCVDCLGRIIDPLKSRCLTIRVPSPSDSEIREALCEVLKKERTACIKDEHIELCVKRGNGNMRRALITLQTLIQQKGENEVVPQSYIQIVSDIANIIATRQGKSGILECRKKFCELLERCIDPATIYRTLVNQLTPLISEKLHPIIWDMALESEGRCIIGSKPIFSLESFVTQAMYEIYISK